MSNNPKTKIAFFFGAGVEGDRNFDIETGFDYLQKSLFASMTANENKEVCFTNFLSKRWNRLSFFYDTYKYTSHTVDALKILLKNFVIQRCKSDNVFKEKHRSQICMLFSADILMKIYGESISSKEKGTSDQKTEDIKAEFKDIVTGKLQNHRDIKSTILQDLFSCDSKGKIVIDMTIGVAGSLDSYFHTIIDPKKYGLVKFSKIINYYWACYFTILRSVLRYLYTHGVEKAKSYLTSPLFEKLNYEKVLSDLKGVTNLIYDSQLNYSIDGTYYQYIIEYLKKSTTSIDCIGVVTTNYYQFCSKISSRTIYLNGQLKYFECPEVLEVVDITKKDIPSSTFCFPFMFGQSLIKPIVHEQQIEEFFQFKKLLEEIDVLIVFGFNINEDDNHINTFLHEFAKKKKIVIVTNQDPHKFNAENKLKCDGKNIEYCEVTYDSNSEVVKQIFATINSLNEANGG